MNGPWFPAESHSRGTLPFCRSVIADCSTIWWWWLRALLPNSNQTKPNWKKVKNNQKKQNKKLPLLVGEIFKANTIHKLKTTSSWVMRTILIGCTSATLSAPKTLFRAHATTTKRSRSNTKCSREWGACLVCADCGLQTVADPASQTFLIVPDQVEFTIPEQALLHRVLAAMDERCELH